MPIGNFVVKIYGQRSARFSLIVIFLLFYLNGYIDL